MRHYEGKFTTGKTIERELFGSVEEHKNREEMKKYAGNFEIYFREAIDLVKKCQPYDNSDPEPDFANDLHARVAEHLGLDNYNDLMLYTAVGSYLDYKKHVDAFFELKTGGNKKILITLDCTVNPRKGESEFGYPDNPHENDGRPKADIVFLVPEGGVDRKVEREQYLGLVNFVAKRTIEEIEQRRSILKI